MESCFDSSWKNFGFGFMRLPMLGDRVDTEQVKQMVDEFLAAGFCYFDTAHGYIDGKSELAIGECLAGRYPREKFILTNKLSGNYFETQADIRPLFQRQLEACGVDYFDFYLMHAQSAKKMPHFTQARAYETALELKAEGKIRHLGMSFHDSAEVLDQILTAHPEVEAVQLQFNYLDYDDPKVQSRDCYRVCREHGKEVLVMEPVKGGALVNLPPEGQAILSALGGGSAASYAIRFAAGFPGIRMVLSGMSNLAQLRDNIGFMKDFAPLSSRERRAVEQVHDLLRAQSRVSCTGCRYCTEVCPQEIPIPEVFAALNAFRQKGTPAPEGITAYACAKCGACEGICPQSLPIRELLDRAKEEL